MINISDILVKKNKFAREFTAEAWLTTSTFDKVLAEKKKNYFSFASSLYLTLAIFLSHTFDTHVIGFLTSLARKNQSRIKAETERNSVEQNRNPFFLHHLFILFIFLIFSLIFSIAFFCFLSLALWLFALPWKYRGETSRLGQAVGFAAGYATVYPTDHATVCATVCATG